MDAMQEGIAMVQRGSDRVFWGACAGVLVLFSLVVFWMVSPFLAASDLRDAVQEGDADRVISYIDFDAVRSAAREQLNEALADNLVGDGDESTKGLTVAFGAFAVALGDRMIDVFLTPAGVRKLVMQQSMGNKRYDVSSRWDGGDEMRLQVRTDNDDRLTVVMRRRGFATWRVTEFRGEPGGGE